MIERFTNDGLVSTAEFATLVGVTPQSIRNWIKAGKITHVRIGGFLIKIPRSEIARIKTLIPAVTQAELRTKIDR